MLASGILWAVAVKDCFILAGFILLLSTALANRATAPVTTGEATLVPLRDRHPEWRADPRTPLLYVTMSGLTRPYPYGNSYRITIMHVHVLVLMWIYNYTLIHGTTIQLSHNILLQSHVCHMAHPCCHSSGWERGEFIFIVNPAHSNHIHHVGRIIEGSNL